MAKAANAYLVFNGTCGEAFDLYRSVIGGEFAMRSTFADMPVEDGCAAPSDGEKDKIMHVSLPIGASVLMGSDCPDSQPPVEMGTNIAVAINTESEEEADKIFAGLSEGGQPFMPMGKMFWGAYFGMCKDKFGIIWQVHYDYGHQGQ